MSEDNKERAAGNEKPSEELSTQDLKQVTGGVQKIELAKGAKADAKAFIGADAYSKG
jgi:bacteriocin-like protein